MIKKLTKKEIKKLIDEGKIVVVYYEGYWKYPKTGDNQKSCPMLDMMFNIERKGGYVIHIPDVEK